MPDLTQGPPPPPDGRLVTGRSGREKKTFKGITTKTSCSQIQAWPFLLRSNPNIYSTQVYRKEILQTSLRGAVYLWKCSNDMIKQVVGLWSFHIMYILFGMSTEWWLMIEIVRLFLQRCEVVVSREIVIVENTRLVRLLYFYYI